MEKKEVGKLLTNASIEIDYENLDKNGKPKVKFKYPGKDKTTTGIQTLVIMVVVFGIILGGFYSFSGEWYDYPTNCVYSQPEQMAKGQFNYTLTCDNGLKETFGFSPGRNLGSETFFYKTGPSMVLEAVTPLILVTLATFLTFFLNYLFAKIVIKRKMFNGYFNEKIPKMMAGSSGHYYFKEFTEVPDSLYIEIPLFKNIRLEYSASKDFSKYLKKFEIKELDFDYAYFSKGKPKRKHKQDKLWCARWYFKEKPNTGKMEVKFI